MPNNSPRTRRDVLAASAVALTTAATAGCLSSARPGGDDTPTATPEPDATVTVGPDGQLVFEPARLDVAPGATVEWVWRSDAHNVVVDDRPTGSEWTGSPGADSALHDAGFSFTHTFDMRGVYAYYCQPHRAAGMTGELVVTDSPAGTDHEQRSAPGAEQREHTPTDGADPVVDRTGRDEVTVEVGPSGRLAFDPAAVRFSRDATVTWVWRSDQHNLVPATTPAAASWNGTPGDPSQVYDEGYTYEATFSAPGEYTYYCQPHRTAGMTGRFIVE